MKPTWSILLVLELFVAPAAIHAQYTYTNADGSIYDYSTNADGVSLTITRYSGPPWAVSVPINIKGLTVTDIGLFAFQACTGLGSVTIACALTNGEELFWGCTSLSNVTMANTVTTIGNSWFDDCTSLTHVTIPGSVTNIQTNAFYGCTNLISVYFEGNAPNPNNDTSVFAGDNNATVYYLPGTTGWSNTFAGLPTALWLLPNPQILNNSPTFGVQSNAFGFTVSWATNTSVVVETTADLANPAWIPLATNTLTNGSFSFSDPQWTNFPDRFYRISAP